MNDRPRYIRYRKKLDLCTPEKLAGPSGTLLSTDNPDFEFLYADVECWLFEIDGESGRVTREVGLDGGGEPIALAPWGCNFGVFVDASPDPEDGAHEETTEEEFEARWNEASDRLGGRF